MLSTIVYAGPEGHSAWSLRTRHPEFEDTISALCMQAVPEKKVGAS